MRRALRSRRTVPTRRAPTKRAADPQCKRNAASQDSLVAPAALLPARRRDAWILRPASASVRERHVPRTEPFAPRTNAAIAEPRERLVARSSVRRSRTPALPAVAATTHADNSEERASPKGASATRPDRTAPKPYAKKAVALRAAASSATAAPAANVTTRTTAATGRRVFPDGSSAGDG